MEPLDLTNCPPRSCHEELDGLMLLPRTIDKFRGLLPGGAPGVYFINGPILGISGYLLQRLGITEAEFSEAVQSAATDDDVAAWVRTRTNTSQYPAINETMRRPSRVGIHHRHHRRRRSADVPRGLARLQADNRQRSSTVSKAVQSASSAAN